MDWGYRSLYLYRESVFILNLETVFHGKYFRFLKLQNKNSNILNTTVFSTYISE